MTLIQTIHLQFHQMILKHPQNGSLKGISTLLLASGPQGKLMKTQVSVCQLWRSSIYQMSLFLSTTLKYFTTLLPNPLAT